jgi:hypothetical protein
MLVLSITPFKLPKILFWSRWRLCSHCQPILFYFQPECSGHEEFHLIIFSIDYLTRTIHSCHLQHNLTVLEGNFSLVLLEGQFYVSENPKKSLHPMKCLEFGPSAGKPLVQFIESFLGDILDQIAGWKTTKIVGLCSFRIFGLKFYQII